MKRLVDLNRGALFEDTTGLVGSAPFKLGEDKNVINWSFDMWFVIWYRSSVLIDHFCWLLKTIIIVTGEQRRQGPDNVDLNRRAIYHHTKMEAPSKPLHMGKNSYNFKLTFCFWYKKVKIKGFFYRAAESWTRAWQIENLLQYLSWLQKHE